MMISQVTDILEISNTRHGPAADLDDRSRESGEHDHLATADEARRYLASRGMSVPTLAPDPDELDRLRDLRDVAQATAIDTPDVVRQRLERLLPRYTYQLSVDGALRPSGSGWDRFIAAAIPGLLELMTSGDRLRRCGNPDCGWLFVDRSRNHTRRWCDMGTCGSRAKMARYRRRKRTAA